jgi:hypothetical protein
VKSRAGAGILAERSAEKRRIGEALIREADSLRELLFDQQVRLTSDMGQKLIRHAVSG